MRLIGMRLMAMHLVGVHLMGMYFMGMHFMGMHLMGVGLTGIYLIPRTGQHLVQPRRSLDGKAPYPWAEPLSFRQSVTREDPLQSGRLAPKL
jgi:hypothetical protein